MAVMEGEYLLLQQGEKLYMLLRNADKFHLFTVDRRFTEEREERLMQLYPCSENTLRELGVSFSALTLRGVAANGCGAGDTVILYVGKKKHRYILSDDYTQEQMAHFFEGVEKYQMPKSKRKYRESDWRLATQKKEQLPLMKGIKVLLVILGVISGTGMLLHHPLWSLLGILVSITCAVLDLVFPQYFTLLDMAKGSEQKHAIGLAFPAALPLMLQILYVVNRFNFRGWEIFLWSGGIALVICVVFALYSREFSERTGDLLALLLLLAFSCAGPIGMVNGLTGFTEPDTYSVIVEDMYIPAGKNERHYCTATLKNGEEFDLKITGEQYERIVEGQTIFIAHHEGGLGIDYISLVES